MKMYNLFQLAEKKIFCHIQYIHSLCALYFQTSDTEVVYKKLVRQTYITLSRSVARKDQIALGLNICKHAYPDIVPEKVRTCTVHQQSRAGDYNLHKNVCFAFRYMNYNILYTVALSLFPFGTHVTNMQLCPFCFTRISRTDIKCSASTRTLEMIRKHVRQVL